MKKATMSNCRSADCSKKGCVCGGHNAGNAKKNRKHNGTKRKLQRRAARRVTP